MQLPELSSQNVFLTGATGVLGAHLLKEILSSTDSDVYCLVRADSAASALARLHTLMRAYDRDDSMAAEFAARVKPVLGDITSPLLDMTQAQYDELAGKIDVVLHGAAMTNLFARFSKIEPINVGGTRNLIEFALKTRQRYMCYVSSYTVMGDKTFDSTFLFRESDYDVGQGFEHMTYQQTKFIGEGLVRAAGDRGLRWKIIRPGQIFGEAATGYYPQGQTNVSGLFYDIFKTVIESGVALYSDTVYDITPVDYVSRATLHLALADKSVGSTYHLTNPHHSTYTQIIQTIADLGYPIRFVSQGEYKRLLQERQLLVAGEEYKSYTTAAFKWWFKREKFDFSASARTDAAAARAVLEPRGIRCPKIDRDLIGVYIERGIQDGYFPAAQTRVTPDIAAPTSAAARYTT